MQVDLRQEGGTVTAGLSGDWRSGQPIPRFEQLLADYVRESAPRVIDFDATGLGDWDSSLLTFLMQGMRYCEVHGLEFREGSLPEDVARLLELSRVVPERDIERNERDPSAVARLGKMGLAAYGEILAMLTFTGEVGGSLMRLALRRTRMRWRDFWVAVQSNGSGALPIVGVIAFLIGVIISFLGAVVLQRFGAGYYVSYLVGYGILREMGALMTGIIMAGRTGAGFAAELGSMKITEEIDAYRTLGISPVDHLVMPRMLGLFVMMPLLALYADFIGIVGGMVVALAVLDLSVTQFANGLLTAVTLGDGLLGVFKAGVFGLVIGLAGCMKGIRAGGDAGAVGRAATSAVVLGITLIIAANAVIDWLAVLLEV